MHRRCIVCRPWMLGGKQRRSGTDGPACRLAKTHFAAARRREKRSSFSSRSCLEASDSIRTAFLRVRGLCERVGRKGWAARSTGREGRDRSRWSGIEAGSFERQRARIARDRPFQQRTAAFAVTSPSIAGIKGRGRRQKMNLTKRSLCRPAKRACVPSLPSSPYRASLSPVHGRY